MLGKLLGHRSRTRWRRMIDSKLQDTLDAHAKTMEQELKRRHVMDFEELRKRALAYLDMEARTIPDDGRQSLNHIVLYGKDDTASVYAIDVSMMAERISLLALRLKLEEDIAKTGAIGCFSIIDLFLGTVIDAECAAKWEAARCDVETAHRNGWCRKRDALALFIETPLQRTIYHQFFRAENNKVILEELAESPCADHMVPPFIRNLLFQPQLATV